MLFHTTLAAFGVAALLRSSPVVFHILKFAGAAYLIWIGIKARRSQGLSAADTRWSQPLTTSFRQGVIGNMSLPAKNGSLAECVKLTQGGREDG